MTERMSIEDFEKSLKGRNIADCTNNIGLDIRMYSGEAIHLLPQLECTLGMIGNWIRRGWFDKNYTFEQFSTKDPTMYKMLIGDLYKGFKKGLFNI